MKTYKSIKELESKEKVIFTGVAQLEDTLTRFTIVEEPTVQGHVRIFTGTAKLNEVPLLTYVQDFTRPFNHKYALDQKQYKAGNIKNIPDRIQDMPCVYAKTAVEVTEDIV